MATISIVKNSNEEYNFIVGDIKDENAVIHVDIPRIHFSEEEIKNSLNVFSNKRIDKTSLNESITCINLLMTKIIRFYAQTMQEVITFLNNKEINDAHMSKLSSTYQNNA